MEVLLNGEKTPLLHFCSTYASHHLCSYMTYTAFTSEDWSHFLKYIFFSVTVSEAWENVLTLIFVVIKTAGINSCNFCMISLTDLLKKFTKNSGLICSSWATYKKIDGWNIFTAYWYSCIDVIIWFLYWHCKFALSANLFTIPAPSHSPLPYVVAELCHSSTLKSIMCKHKLVKFFLVFILHNWSIRIMENVFNPFIKLCFEVVSQLSLEGIHCHCIGF